MFTEAGKDIIPLEDNSRRKWDNAMIADLDQNGHQDLLLTEHGMHANVYWNEGGKFSEPQKVVGGDTHGVAAGDFDQDGHMEMIIYPGGGGGKNPSNPVEFHLDGRKIDGGGVFENFERCRGRAAKFVDCGNHGVLDLVTTAFPLETQKAEGANHLFRNDGTGKLEFVSKLPQAKWMGFRTLLTDFNSDGKTDLIFYGGGNMVAAQADEGLAFSNVSGSVFGKLAKTDFVTSISEIDYDNDGDFDLLLTRANFPFSEETSYSAENSTFAYYVFASFTEDVPYQYDLKIEGDFKMENIQTAYPDFDIFIGSKAEKVELGKDVHRGKDLTLSEEEAAGYPAELTKNGLHIGYLGEGMWRVGGKTKSATSGVVLNVKKAPPATPSIELPVMLFENRKGTFADVTKQLGISVMEETAGAAAGDFNNDGWTDLFIVREGDPATKNEQILLLNQGGKSFAPAENAGILTRELGATGCGAEAFDYDEDGDLDLIFCNERGRWHLYTNNETTDGSNNFVTVKVGNSPTGKATAQGAILSINAGENVFKRVVGASSAAFSHPMNTHLHVGLGKIDKITSASVKWSNGETQELVIDSLNQSVTAGKLR